jgi:hypothetical protein
MLDEDQQTAFDMAKDGHNLVVIVQRAHRLKGRCIFIDLDMGIPEQVA